MTRGGGERRAIRDRREWQRDERRAFPEQRIAGETGVPLTAVGIEDPEVCAPPRRPEVVPGDHHLRPLADDVAAEPDPRPTRELQAEPHRFTDRAGDARRERRRLQDHEETARPTRERRQPMQPIRDSRRAPARPIPGPASHVLTAEDHGQIDEQEIHGATLEQRTRDAQPFVERLRREHDEPLEADAPRDGLHRIEGTREVQVRDDRAAGLCFCRQAQRERGLAAGGVPMERDAGQPGNSSRAKDRVQRREASMDDAPVIDLRAFRRPIVERPWSGRFLLGGQRDGGERPDDRQVVIRRSEVPRSCGAPASLEGRQSCRDLR